MPEAANIQCTTLIKNQATLSEQRPVLVNTGTLVNWYKCVYCKVCAYLMFTSTPLPDAALLKQWVEVIEKHSDIHVKMF